MSQYYREQEFAENVRRAVEQMKARREAVRQFEKLARQDPETVSRRVLVRAVEERDETHRKLEESFGFTVRREGRAFHCAYIAPERAPRTLGQAAQWADSVVSLASWELALQAMKYAQFFPVEDQARKTCDAFVDVMEQAPALYNLFTGEAFDPLVRDYAAAVVAGWVRAYLKSYGRTGEALMEEGWALRLASAAAQAWQELEPGSLLSRGSRYRDSLPRTKDGRRQRAGGPRSYVNLTDAIFTDRRSEPAESLEVELARFADREVLLKHARDRARAAGLTPREQQVYLLIVQNPGITYREVAEKLGISVNQVGVIKHRIKQALGAIR